jgi:hypothetical protein
MRLLYLQDDTFFPAQARWLRTDGSATVLSDPVATAVLEQHFGLDLAPLRHVVDDDDAEAFRLVSPWLRAPAGYGLDAIPLDRLAEARVLLAAHRAEHDRAWTTPSAMRDALTRLLDALGPAEAFPGATLLQALAEAPLEVAVEAEDLTGGRFHDELRDLIAMCHWAELRSAQRVRLLLK